MAETRRTPAAIDFDEIERQIRESANSTSARKASDDPLADLARLVGHPTTGKETADWRNPPGLDPRLEDAMRSLEDFLRVGGSDKEEPVAMAPQQPTTMPKPAIPPVARVAAEPVHEMQPAYETPADEWQLRPTSSGERARGNPVDLDEVSGRILMASAPVVAATSAAATAVKRQIAPLTRAAPEATVSLETATSPANTFAPAPNSDPLVMTPPNEPEPEYDEAAYAPPRRSRKGLFVSAAMLGIAAVGVAGALTFRGVRTTPPNGEPPIIRADATPIKVSPVNPGGLDVPDQNKQVLQRSAAPAGPGRIVISEEQPVDVKAIAREPAKPRVILPAPGVVATRDPNGNIRPPDEATGAVPPNGSPLGEPRRVRTVTIRTNPQGIGPPPGVSADVVASKPTVVAAAPTLPSAPVSRSIRLPDAALATPPTPSAAAAKPEVTKSDVPKPDVAKSIAALAPSPKAEAPKVAPVVVPPNPEASVPTPPPLPKPVAKAKPKAKPAPKPVAARPEEKPIAASAGDPPTPANVGDDGAPLKLAPAAKPKRLAAARTPPGDAPAAAPRPSVGGSAVQVASATSEAEARNTLASLRSRFPELASQNPGIQRAEVNGQTRWRIRAGGLSPDAARQLCASITSKGGACFVAR